MLVFLASMASANPDLQYAIGPGDVVSVQVYDMMSLSGNYTVTSDGNLPIPYCAPAPTVIGKTVLEATESVRDCLKNGVLVDPQVNILVSEYRSQKVDVRGGVAKPGPYFLRGHTTLRAVLGDVGDVDSATASGTVSVFRGTERTTISVTSLAGEAGAMAIQAGDVIVVEQSEVVFVGGEVEKPGAIAFIEGLTVTTALMQAGDATGVANLAKAYVLRDGERISTNLRKIRKGKRSDVQLQPNDQLVVPESPL